MASEARTSGSASAAPEPSPSRRPRSSSGSSPSARSCSVCAGSGERCEAIRRPVSAGASRAATSAAAPVMTPSITHRHAARARPERHAREHADLEAAHAQPARRPGRPGRGGAARARAGRRRPSAGAARRRCPCRGRRPRRARAPSSAAVTAAAEVVLAMPMSPSATRRRVQLGREPDARLERRLGDLARHGRLRREVGRARAEPQVTDARIVERLDDARVDDHELARPPAVRARRRRRRPRRRSRASARSPPAGRR